MAEIKDVKVYSGIKGTVGLTAPSANLRRTWTRKGQMLRVPFDALQMAVYEPGVEFLFKSGALIIKEQDIRIELGLEEAEADEKDKVIDLTEDEAKNMLKSISLKDFREKVAQLSMVQAIDLCETAVELKIQDFQRCKILQDKTGILVFDRVMDALKEEAQG